MVEGIEGSSALTLEQFAATEFGELPESTDAAPAEPAAGTPSTPPATPEAPPPASPEVPAGAIATPATAAPEKPSDAAPTPADAPPAATPTTEPADDPFKDATPFTYTVDGQAKTYDGIKVLGEAGAVIDPASLPDLQRRLGERDHLVEANQQLYQRTQQYEKAGGLQKLRALEVEKAQYDVAGQKLLDTVKQMLGAPEHKEVLASVLRELSVDIREAKLAAEGRLQQAEQTAVQTETQGAQREQVFGGAIRQIKQALPHLTDEDVKAGEQHFRQFLPALFRPATPADAQQFGFKVGEEIFDAPKMNGWFQDRAGLRAQQATEAAARKQAEADRPKIDAENNARLAAAMKGTKAPSARPVVPAKRPEDPTKKSQRATDADSAWDLLHGLAH